MSCNSHYLIYASAYYGHLSMERADQVHTSRTLVRPTMCCTRPLRAYRPIVDQRFSRLRRVSTAVGPRHHCTYFTNIYLV